MRANVHSNALSACHVPYSGVQCSDYVAEPGIIDSCTNLANSMEASSGSKIFGTTSASQFHLPYLKSGKSCILCPSVPFRLTGDIIDDNRRALITTILSHESQSQQVVDASLPTSNSLMQNFHHLPD